MGESGGGLHGPGDVEERVSGQLEEGGGEIWWCGYEELHGWGCCWVVSCGHTLFHTKRIGLGHDKRAACRPGI